VSDRKTYLTRPSMKRDLQNFKTVEKGNNVIFMRVKRQEPPYQTLSHPRPSTGIVPNSSWPLAASTARLLLHQYNFVEYPDTPPTPCECNSVDNKPETRRASPTEICCFLLMQPAPHITAPPLRTRVRIWLVCEVALGLSVAGTAGIAAAALVPERLVRPGNQLLPVTMAGATG